MTIDLSIGEVEYLLTLINMNNEFGGHYNDPKYDIPLRDKLRELKKKINEKVTTDTINDACNC
jgi:hypothetical protein